MKENEERIPHPHKKGFTCIKISIKCNCPCHDPGCATMHFMDCCDNGFTEKYVDIKPDLQINK